MARTTKKTAKSAKTTTKKAALPEFDKYFHYKTSVQSPDEDVKFLRKMYRNSRGAKTDAKVFREDFCGTFDMCCEWVKLGPEKLAYGIDLDPEPIAYGREHYLSKLRPEQQSRVKVLEANVLAKDLPKADLICAMNFSYFIFKQRQMLKDYFANALRTLNADGVLVLDCFGGSACMEANEEETEYTDVDFSYYWDQDSYNPVTNHAQYYIHFKRKGEPKREKVFSYDWRMWSIPELRDILLEVGFKGVDVYWEGTDEDGEGDGEFTKVEPGQKGEECESYVAYIVALK